MHPFWILLVGMAVVIGGILVLRLHAVLALLFGALAVAALSPAQETIGERIAQGFAGTLEQVGILIAMAAIIGTCLLESGAADRLVRTALRWLGKERAPVAFMGSGFLLGIPVFFDTVFYLMIPLAKAMRLRTGTNYLFYVLSICAGGTMAHSLVPPTPGPLFMAGELGVDLGVMILVGCAIGLIASSAGYLYARWANGKFEIPLRESEASLSQFENLARREDKELPSLWLSATPILLPVILIAATTILAPGAGEGPPTFGQSLLLTLGDKNIALILAAVIALLMLLKATSGKQTVRATRDSLSTAGVIILIIGAGGAFGRALQQTGIGGEIQEVSTQYQIPVLLLAWVLTALIRTAQGSATVAMITAAGVFAGMADPAQLGFHPVYLAMAIGCGSKPIWWMNDSGFWVVAEMSGMTEQEALKTLTPLAATMGVVGLIATVVGAWLFPLVIAGPT
ncbi:MAG: GntP family permease [Acidobacteriota bacterium]